MPRHERLTEQHDQEYYSRSLRKQYPIALAEVRKARGAASEPTLASEADAAKLWTAHLVMHAYKSELTHGWKANFFSCCRSAKQYKREQYLYTVEDISNVLAQRKCALLTDEGYTALKSSLTTTIKFAMEDIVHELHPELVAFCCAVGSFMELPLSESPSRLAVEVPRV